MPFDEELEKGIAKIIADLQCPKGFKCYRSGFEDLCKAKDLGMESFLECREKAPRECPFAYSFGSTYLCKCTLRVFLAKKLEK